MPDIAHWLERFTFVVALIGFPSLAAAAWFTFLMRRIESEADIKAERERVAAEIRDRNQRAEDYKRLSDPLFRYREKTQNVSAS
ncbi:MAG: hypothetical protein IT462_14520 [Planctomycetes bacterium]|nr:hypothetical protein [Planctomycetota bacterium]